MGISTSFVPSPDMANRGWVSLVLPSVWSEKEEGQSSKNANCNAQCTRLKLLVHLHNTGKQSWDMSCQSIMPILAMACAPKHLKTSSGYLFTYIYLLITRCFTSIIAQNTMKYNIHIVIVGYIWFPCI